MVKTQVYLTDPQKSRLSAIAAETGKSQSELIRDAVDGFVQQYGVDDWKQAIRNMRGVWEGRDPAELEAIRREADRYLRES